MRLKYGDIVTVVDETSVHLGRTGKIVETIYSAVDWYHVEFKQLDPSGQMKKVRYNMTASQLSVRVC